MEYRVQQILRNIEAPLNSIAAKYDYYFHGESQVVRLGDQEFSTGPAIILPTGHIAVSVSDDVIIYDLKNHILIATLSGHTGFVSHIKTLSNGDIVTASRDGTIRLWNSVNFNCYDILRHHTDEIWDILILADDTIVSSARDGKLILWTSSQEFDILSDNGHTYFLAILDADHIVAGSITDNLLIWNTKTTMLEKGFDNSQGISRILVINNKIVAGRKNGSITIYEDKKETTIYGNGNTIRSMCIISDDVIITGSNDGTIAMWNLKTYTKIHSFTVSNIISSILKLPNGNIMIGVYDSTFYMYNPITRQLMGSFVDKGASTVLLLFENKVVNVMSHGQITIWE